MNGRLGGIVIRRVREVAARDRLFPDDGWLRYSPGPARVRLGSTTGSETNRAGGTVLEIVDLADDPNFADTVADRGWKAWRADEGMTIDEYRAGLDPMLSSQGVPFCLVAKEGGNYLGSVLVIENDLEDRPQYAPWIAALWVDSDHRRNGYGRKLLTEAHRRVFDLGHETCYLCTISDNDDYYLERGFDLLESNVRGLNIYVRTRRP